MDRQQPTFFDRVNAGFGSPMTQFGLNLLAGSMQGDPGKGVASGAQAAGRAQQLQYRQMQEMQAEQERRRAAGAAQAEQAQKQKLFVDAIAGADPKVRPILQMLGPQAAGKFLLEQTQAKTAPPKLMNVGGRLVRVGPNGQPEILMEAPDESGKVMNFGGAGYVMKDGKPQLVIPRQKSLAEKLLEQSMSGQQGAPAPQGGFIQQSNPVAPGGDPNLQLTAGDTPGAQQAAPQQDLVTIPGIGQMLRSQAEQLRSAFALEGNKAGADLLDEALNPASSQIGEAGSNEVDKQLINSGNALSRLAEIQRQFKPEYQQYGTRVEMAFTDLMDRFGAADNFPPEQLEKFTEYRQYRQSAIDNINRYIKEITGAQMSEAEAKRLRQGVPDAGDNPLNPFSGDSPKSFKAKLDQSIRTMALAQARFHYLKKQGFQFDYVEKTDEDGNRVRYLRENSLPVTPNQMGQIIDNRANQLLQEAKANGMSRQQAAPMIKKQLQSEFGIAI